MKSESAHLNGDSHTHVLSRSQNIIKTDLRPVDLADWQKHTIGVVLHYLCAKDKKLKHWCPEGFALGFVLLGLIYNHSKNVVKLVRFSTYALGQRFSFCWLCGPIVFTEQWRQSVSSWVQRCWDVHQHLWARAHGSQTEMGVLPAPPGLRRSCFLKSSISSTSEVLRLNIRQIQGASAKTPYGFLCWQQRWTQQQTCRLTSWSTFTSAFTSGLRLWGGSQNKQQISASPEGCLGWPLVTRWEDQASRGDLF